METKNYEEMSVFELRKLALELGIKKPYIYVKPKLIKKIRSEVYVINNK